MNTSGCANPSDIEPRLGLNKRSISTTANKVKEFYDTDQLKHAEPVPGSLDALNRLRDMGYDLAIVTARSIPIELDSTITWVDKHFDGEFMRQLRTTLICS